MLTRYTLVSCWLVKEGGPLSHAEMLYMDKQISLAPSNGVTCIIFNNKITKFISGL